MSSNCVCRMSRRSLRREVLSQWRQPSQASNNLTALLPQAEGRRAATFPRPLHNSLAEQHLIRSSPVDNGKQTSYRIPSWSNAVGDPEYVVITVEVAKFVAILLDLPATTALGVEMSASTTQYRNGVVRISDLGPDSAHARNVHLKRNRRLHCRRRNARPRRMETEA